MLKKYTYFPLFFISSTRKPMALSSTFTSHFHHHILLYIVKVKPKSIIKLLNRLEKGQTIWNVIFPMSFTFWLCSNLNKRWLRQKGNLLSRFFAIETFRNWKMIFALNMHPFGFSNDFSNGSFTFQFLMTNWRKERYSSLLSKLFSSFLRYRITSLFK